MRNSKHPFIELCKDLGGIQDGDIGSYEGSCVSLPWDHMIIYKAFPLFIEHCSTFLLLHWCCEDMFMHLSMHHRQHDSEDISSVSNGLWV
jgi:hypothetical protein